jgi:hypothetical protein
VALEAYVEGYKCSLSFRRRGTMFEDSLIVRSPAFYLDGSSEGHQLWEPYQLLIGALALVENGDKPMRVSTFSSQ